ncbi:MAG TPA: nucleoside transporter C-terminal domain-containing protein [Rhizomicrobium sp.]|nr:nucleoside transporter C-terminal domain-containing protein [Rhizomicrobium sp.]
MSDFGLTRLQPVLGIIVILFIAWALSEDRRALRPGRLASLMASALLLQAAIALLLLKLPPARDALLGLNGVVTALAEATRAGTSFVFGYVGGASPPFAVTSPGALTSFAFSVLPLVIVISALSALLWYWRILPLAVGGLAFILRKTLKLGGATALGAGTTVFLGMIEAPLLIRPCLSKMSRSELFILFTVGLASVAGTMFVLYATVLAGTVPGALGHVLVASMMALPAAVLIARLMVPGDAATEEIPAELGFRSSMDAVARGTEDGLKIYLQIMALLIVMLALVSLADQLLKLLPAAGGAPLTLERILGWLFSPLVWLYGVPWREAPAAGALMGTKAVLNELVAYINLAGLPKGTLDPRAGLIMVYALCGFANLGSVGILIAGMSSLMPERRAEIVPLCFKALISGTLASGLSACMIGLLI